MLARAKVAAVVAPFLTAKAPTLAAQIAAARDALTKMSTSEARDIAEQILAELDLGDWSALVPEIESLLLAVTEDGISAGFGQIGLLASDALTEQVNAQAVAFARDRAAELVGMRYNEAGELIANPRAEWAITDSTRAMLRIDVTTAVEEGTSTADVAAQLQDAYAFSSERADTIARTELARADVAGNMMSYRDSGVVEGKQWVLGSEHEDEDECDDAAAMGVVDLDDDFGGIGDPPAHPRCVCDVVPVMAAAGDA
ncbi:hypothetical protein BH11GEM2_BH11GEM2_26480 [soil metagenome]